MPAILDLVDPRYLPKYFIAMGRMVVQPMIFISKCLSEGKLEHPLFEAARFLLVSMALIAFFLGVSAFTIQITKLQAALYFAGLLFFISLEAIALRLSWLCVGAAPLRLFAIADCYYWGTSTALAFVFLMVTYGLAKTSSGPWFFIPATLALLVPAVLLFRLWSAYGKLCHVQSRARSVAAGLLYSLVFSWLPFVGIALFLPFFGIDL